MDIDEINTLSPLKSDEIPYQEISDPAVLLKNPIVSIQMLAYNHEPYIADAIQGVIMQKTDFQFELIIGEDCSTDRTREIVLDYQKKYPDLIRVISSDKNVGIRKNSDRTLGACRGKYIAICEGDDYWTDDLKLEKQTSLMLENPGCAICVHPCYLHRSMYNKKSIGFYKGAQVKRFGISDILKNAGQSSPTASYMVIRDVFNILPQWFGSAPVGDLFIEMYSLKIGFGLYMPDVMCAYRVFSQNSWSDMMKRKGGHKLINHAAEMNKCIRYMENESAFRGFDFNILKSTSLMDVAVGHLMEKDFDKFKESISESYAIYPDSSQTQKWLYRFKSLPGLALFLYNLKKLFDRSPVKIF